MPAQLLKPKSVKGGGRVQISKRRTTTKTADGKEGEPSLRPTHKTASQRRNQEVQGYKPRRMPSGVGLPC